MAEIRKGDTVKVIAGKEKGKTGKVLEILRGKGRIRIEKLMTVKRHLRKGRSQGNPEGGIIEKAGTIAISNVMVVGKDGKPVRRERILRELGAKEKARREKQATGSGLRASGEAPRR